MKFFYISTTRIKRVSISKSGGGGGGGGGGGEGSAVANPRRASIRTLLPVVVVLGIFLPFFFVRVAFLVLESAAIDCLGLRYSGGMDTSMRLSQELTRALVEANEGGNTQKEGPINSFSELVKEMTSKRQDIKGFALRTKAMLANMEDKVQSARQRELVFWHFASHGVPKGLHCLCLKLTEEYSVNAMARSRLPPPEYMSRLTDPSFHHVVLLTDNVLAASVVISSTVKNTVNPEKLVFHVVTDKKIYTSMHAWFSINPIKSAIVEVKGLHQFDWFYKVNIGVKEMLEIHRLIWSHYYYNLKKDLQHDHVLVRSLEVLSPHYLSLLNHLRIYIPELFPDLEKIVFLDEDVVVQKDISPLWDLHLNEKVAGAVVGSWCGENCCPGRKYKDYFNFSHPTISLNLDSDRCAWLHGMNIFDLDAWRRSNITTNYHRWLKQSLNSGLELWQPGVLPPALLAFEGHVHPIEPLWLMSGLGQNPFNASIEKLEDAAILHYSGPAKPWLEISFPEIKPVARFETREKKVLPSVSAHTGLCTV